MDSLSILATRAALTKNALLGAPPAGEPSYDPLGMAEGVGSTALLGGTANWARNTYNRIQPSLLSLGESMWRDPAQMEQFRQRARTMAGDQTGRAYAAMDTLAGNRGMLRDVLTGGDMPNHPSNISRMIRDLTFGQAGAPDRGMPNSMRPGDMVMWGPQQEVASPVGALTTALTGNQLNHVGIAGSGSHLLSVNVNDRLQAEPDVRPIAGMRHRGQVMARFRDTSLSPEQAERVRTVAPEVYGRQVRGRGGRMGPVPYDYAKKSDLALRELLPELGSGSGRSWLSGPMNWAAGNKAVSSRLKQVLPEDVNRQLFTARKLQGRCGPGEVCSTAAGRVLQGVGAPVMPEMSPGDVMRNAGPRRRFQPVELHVPEQLRNRAFLLGSHYRRLGPAAIRAPFLAALATLGTVGMADAYRRLSSPQEPAQSPLARLQPAPVPPPQAPPPSKWLGLRRQNMLALQNRATDALSGVWDRLAARYGSHG